MMGADAPKSLLMMGAADQKGRPAAASITQSSQMNSWIIHFQRQVMPCHPYRECISGGVENQKMPASPRIISIKQKFRKNGDYLLIKRYEPEPPA
jgi:hypothetical protein